MVTKTDSIVTGNISHGVQFYVQGVTLPASSLNGNTITNNGGDALSVQYNSGGGLPGLSTNTIKDNTGFNGVVVSGNLGIDTTWPASEPYPLVVGGLTVNNCTLLSIPAGATMRFWNYGSLDVHGALQAVGNVGQPITFTAVNPAPGQWGGICFRAD